MSKCGGTSEGPAATLDAAAAAVLPYCMADRESPRGSSPGAPAGAQGRPHLTRGAARADRATLAAQRVSALLACVVRARGRLDEAEARRLCRFELPGRDFDRALSDAIGAGHLLGLDGMCLVVTASGRALPGVMPPNARVARMVEGASWEHPDGPPGAAVAPAEGESFVVPAGGDLVCAAPTGAAKKLLAARVGGRELDRMASRAREVTVRGRTVTVRWHF